MPTDYTALSGRITRLQNEQGWLTPQAMSAYATSNLSDDEMVNQAEQFRQTIVQADRQAGHTSAYKTFFDDPVLQKHPTVALALRDFLTGAVGVDQIAGQSIRAQQNQLKANGFGSDLPSNGVWDDGWQAAKGQFAQHVTNSELQGNKPGGTTVSHALDFLGAFNPTPAADALLGVVKGLPGDLRQVLADMAGGAAGIAPEISGRINAGIHGEFGQGGYDKYVKTQTAQAESSAQSTVVNALGGNTTPNEQAAQTGMTPQGDLAKGGLATFAGKAIGDLGTVWVAGDVASGLTKVLANGGALGYGAGAAAASDAAETSATAATKGGIVSTSMEGADKAAATYRGPGVLAQKIGQPFMQRVAQVAEHIPTLGNTGPWLDSLADADGAFYRARRFLSVPYTYKPVAAAGEALSTGTLAGAKVRGVAALSSDTPFGKSVEGEHTFDMANEALKNVAKGTPFGGFVDLNNLAFLLHGPSSGAKAVSAQVGSDVSGLVHGVNRAAGIQGWDGLFQQATGMTRKQLVAAAGSEPRYQKWLTDTINKHASYAEAENGVARKTLADAGVSGVAISDDPSMLSEAERSVSEKIFGMDADTVKARQALATEIRNDPKQLAQAQTNLLSRRGGQEFVNRVQRDLSQQREQAMLRGETWPKGTAPHIGQYLDDSELINKDVLPFLPPSGGAAQANEALDAGAEYQANVAGKVATKADPRTTLWKSAPGEGRNLGIADKDLLTREEAIRQAATLQRTWDENTAAKKLYDEKMQEVLDNEINPFGEPPMTEADVEARFPKPDPGWVEQWHDAVGDVAMKMGADQRTMAAKGPDLLDNIRAYAKAFLPGEVVLNDGADIPAPLQNAVDTLAEHGKKLVAGTDIGHMHAGESPLDDFGGTYTWRRRAMNHMGLNPNIVNDADVANNVRTNLRNRIIDAVGKGDITLPAYTRPDTLIAYLHENGFLPDHLTWKGKLHQMFNLKQPQFIDEITDPDLKEIAQKFRNDHPGLSDAEAIVQAQHVATGEVAQHLQMRDLPYRDLREAFGNPRKFEDRAPEAQARTAREAGTNQLNTPMLDDRSIRALQQATRSAYADVPMSMAGWQRPENMFRASMGFAGSGGIKGRMLGGAVLGAAAGVTVDPSAVFGGDFSNVEKGAATGALAGGVFKKLGWAMANLPNNLVRLRNEFRFDLSPEFAVRRWTKVNVKMAAEGVPPIGFESNTLHTGPVAWLEKHGVLDEARATLARTAPEYDTRLQQMDRAGDEAQRYLQAQDVFHMTNMRNMEAYSAYHWSQQGKSDQEIHDLIIKTFGYGAKDAAGVAQSGRSALEKSINTVFFPFSFDKTLYRNLGGYLLDHAGQRMMLTAALASYDQFNKQHPDMPGSADWLDKHVPMLQEVQRVNAFAHGVSLGQFGGINAPMLQLFLPQQWSPSTKNQALLQRYIPAVKDFQRIFTGASGQASVFSAQADIIGSEITGKGQAETPFAQLQQAFDLRRKLDDQWGPTLQFNAGKKATEQIRFSLDPSYGQFAGQPITRATIDRMVHHTYTPYDPAAGAAFAIKNQTQWQDFLDQRGQGVSEYGTELADFGDNVRTLSQKIQDSRYLTPGTKGYWAPQTLESFSTALRNSALRYAETDPQFLALYKTNFEHVLGPLERIQ